VNDPVTLRPSLDCVHRQHR
ncbi:hypothetical protein HaLaN_27465, partial [Haematococcus lacustris]